MILKRKERGVSFKYNVDVLLQPFFPVNFLRNIALENAETKYVFLSDIDFEPMPGLDIHLQDYISKGYLQGKTVRATASRFLMVE